MSANDCILLRENMISIRNDKDKFLSKQEYGSTKDSYEMIGMKLFLIIDLW